ncbi:conserved hypothetical protein [Neospora caninum Liverpool]|uniref:Uncharacterized protein n=1 Tax=Neospora caninum (strain Liverpool) TaxID=572307 RepID=F0VGM2_NEOCL|nr:conserved hypothetical protein [Neospora caninum Liverpool]CBZ52866.1 conserved hypothetical protein [Neospora caninum Liverpool]CEL66847.1 TPA: hypothetical protein BN1204_026550 [Neospora caninum Liverpool]|eukprot:XP_003882898.1 conserved hypothetical protein [Neospora caninum Liverpool]
MSASADNEGAERVCAQSQEGDNEQAASSYPGSREHDCCGNDQAAKGVLASHAKTPTPGVFDATRRERGEGDEMPALPLSLPQRTASLARAAGEPLVAEEASPSQHSSGDLAREMRLEDLEASENCARGVVGEGTGCLAAWAQQGTASESPFPGFSNAAAVVADGGGRACAPAEGRNEPGSDGRKEGCGLSLFIRPTGEKWELSAGRMEDACREKPSCCEHEASCWRAPTSAPRRQPPSSSLHFPHLQIQVENGNACQPLATVDESLKGEGVRLDHGFRTLLEEGGEGSDDEIVESSAMKRGNSWPYFWVRRHLLLERRSLMYFSVPLSPCAPPRGFLPLHARTRVLVLPERASLYGRTDAYLLAVFNLPPTAALLPAAASKASLLSSLAAFLPTLAAPSVSPVSPPSGAPPFLPCSSFASLPPRWRRTRGHRTKHPESPSFHRLSTSSDARSPSVAALPWSPINPILAIKVPTLSASSQPPLLASASDTCASSESNLDVSGGSSERRPSAFALPPPVVICSPASFSAAFDSASQPKFLFDFGDPVAYCRFCRALALAIRRVQRQADAKKALKLSQRLAHAVGAPPRSWEKGTLGHSNVHGKNTAACSSCAHASERTNDETFPSRLEAAGFPSSAQLGVPETLPKEPFSVASILAKRGPENATDRHDRLARFPVPPGICGSPVFCPSSSASRDSESPGVGSTSRLGLGEVQSSPGFSAISESPVWSREDAPQPAACRKRFLQPVSCPTDLESSPCLPLFSRADAVPLGSSPTRPCRCRECLDMGSRTVCPPFHSSGFFPGTLGPALGGSRSLSNAGEVLSRLNAGHVNPVESSRNPVRNGEFFPENASAPTRGYAEPGQLEPRPDIVEALSSLLECLKNKRREQRDMEQRARQEGRHHGCFEVHSGAAGAFCAAHQNRSDGPGQVNRNTHHFFPAEGHPAPICPSREPPCYDVPTRDVFVDSVGPSSLHLASHGAAQPDGGARAPAAEGDCRRCKSEGLERERAETPRAGLDQRSRTESRETIRSLNRTMNKLLHALEEFSPQSPQWLGVKAKRDLAQQPDCAFPTNNTTTASPVRESKGHRAFGGGACPTDPWFASLRGSEYGDSLNIATETASDFGSSRPSTSRRRDVWRLPFFGKDKKEARRGEEQCRGLHTVSATSERYLGVDESTRAFSANKEFSEAGGSAAGGSVAEKDLLLVQQQDQLERLRSVVEFLLRQQELQLVEGRPKDEAALREEWEEQQRLWEVERRLRFRPASGHSEVGLQNVAIDAHGSQNEQLPATDALECPVVAAAKQTETARPENGIGAPGRWALPRAAASDHGTCECEQGEGDEDTESCLVGSSLATRFPPHSPLSGSVHGTSRQEGGGVAENGHKERSPPLFEGETMVGSCVSPLVRASQMTENEDFFSTQRILLHGMCQPDALLSPEKKAEQPLFFSISTPRFRLDTCDDDDDNLPKTTDGGGLVQQNWGGREGNTQDRMCCTGAPYGQGPSFPTSAVKRQDCKLGLAASPVTRREMSSGHASETMANVEETVQLHGSWSQHEEEKDKHAKDAFVGETCLERAARRLREVGETGCDAGTRRGRTDAQVPAGDDIKQAHIEFSVPSAAATHAWERLRVSVQQEESREGVLTTSDAGSGVSPTSAGEREGEVEVWRSFPVEQDVERV